MSAAPELYLSTCQTCGDAFAPRRSDGLFCSSACRQRAYRQRAQRQGREDGSPATADLESRASRILQAAVQRLVAAGEIDGKEGFGYLIAPTPRLREAMLEAARREL